ncbi:hypothetical protein F5879DRAFT_984782 [Lentinula edodes]|uniref:uncharacterized protein n=1 Tax=Lentinula edodes TaxID=5353 RepID=UPI001E8E86C0|nr:uncharacterized protein C8R40DRAFT_1164358 [Lentinula edodes]KAH7880927.1 hypothetical protein C8R40DRAFT_1164358 [Lentinula edodes]KAJ3909433.1 hypothetical protein F5879DRAFT_984782 [Lentinula edodes]
MSSNRNHTQTYEAGDHVQYQAIGGGKGTTSTTEGEIQEVITHKRPAGDTGVKVNATPEDPRYTGKETAYKEQNIDGVTE